MHYCARIVICPPVVVNFHHIFDFFSATTEQNIHQNFTGSKISISSTKFVFFWPIRNLKWTPWLPIGWDIFRLFLCIRWMDLNQPFQETRSQRSLPSLCFSYRSEDQDGCPGLWFADTFFDFSATVERNLMKLDRKQDLNICVFGAILKAKMAHPLPSLWFSGWSLSEQDKSFDIEHQPPFGDHFTLPKMRGGLQNKQEHHILLTKYEAVHLKVVRVGKLFSMCSIHNVGTQVHQCGLLVFFATL